MQQKEVMKKWMQEMEISMEQKPVNKHAFKKIALQQGEGGWYLALYKPTLSVKVTYTYSSDKDKSTTALSPMYRSVFKVLQNLFYHKVYLKRWGFLNAQSNQLWASSREWVLVAQII